MRLLALRGGRYLQFHMTISTSSARGATTLRMERRARVYRECMDSQSIAGDSLRHRLSMPGESESSSKRLAAAPNPHMFWVLQLATSTARQHNSAGLAFLGGSRPAQHPASLCLLGNYFVAAGGSRLHRHSPVDGPLIRSPSHCAASR